MYNGLFFRPVIRVSQFQLTHPFLFPRESIPVQYRKLSRLRDSRVAQLRLSKSKVSYLEGSLVPTTYGTCIEFRYDSNDH
eukprot:COSAG02_NODE_1428_length_12662_cov_12.695137_1_plen_79_part_10